ncbi:glycosyltransferase family 2 protein [Fibrella aquatica]|uniref:glycosyltransferase family 2 protein n=1 Tax=Fibrella aquatica TaxID=3242487 RepID=UPI003522B631
MAQLPQLTIIIPTRNRAETLVHTLRTCTEQDYDHLRIIVSDNMSSDDTRQVVAACGDPRVEYINPGKSLSMSHHWEFALSHVTSGYVSVLGDDDGFTPGAVREAATIIAKTGTKALSTNYGLYWWPSVFDASRANQLHVSFRSGYQTLDAAAELGHVIAGKKHYLAIPCLYNSFIHCSLIEAAKQPTGTFFHSQIPDVYSSVAITGLLDTFVYSQKSLKVFGVSGKSNGAAHLGKPGNEAVAKLFYQEETIPIHPMASNTLGKSIGLIIGESLLQSFDAGLNQAWKAKFDWQIFFEAAIREANTTGVGQKEEIYRNIREIAQKNNVPEYDSADLENRTMIASSAVSVVSRLKDLVVIVDAPHYGVVDIFGACALYNAVYERPLAHPHIVWSTLSKLTETAAFKTLLKYVGVK